MSRPRCLSVVALVAFVGILGASGCSSAGTAAGPRGDCPVAPVRVVVTVDQWGDIAEQLAGDCADVTTIIEGSGGDPHEFEPSPSDNAAFGRADLVVVNGLGYDSWADKVLGTVSPRPPVVDAGEVVGGRDGDNPHLWYDPAAVEEVSRAITEALGQSAPDAQEYFSERAADWSTQLGPYRAAIDAARVQGAGRSYVATEWVFDDMARAVGLVDATPAGYRSAAAAGSDPSPADVNALEDVLREGGTALLVYNTQTEGSVPAGIRDVADRAGIPVVDVTETVPPGQSSFVAWQIDQLRSLTAALGG